MKHKHSPNFHTNLEEADKAKNNRAATFFWTVVLIATLMLGFSLTSCNTEHNQNLPENGQVKFIEYSSIYMIGKDSIVYILDRNTGKITDSIKR